MVKIMAKGSFKKTERFLKNAKKPLNMAIVHKYGKLGVAALSSATPISSGKTSNSWHYKIINSKNKISLEFFNTNIQNGIPIAIIIQYGHATKNGKWVEGRDYVNPAIQPIFDKLSEDMWKEVTNGF